MSYDIYLVDKEGSVIQLDKAHQLYGGTYALGGTTEAWLNITYNYSKFFYTVIDGDKGIRAIYGKTGAEAIPILDKAIVALALASLGTKPSNDYWEATPGNALKALTNLRELCTLAPEARLKGD